MRKRRIPRLRRGRHTRWCGFPQGSLLQRTDTSANLIVRWNARGVAYTRAASLSRMLDRRGVQFLQATDKTALTCLRHVSGCFVILERNMSQAHETPATARKARYPSPFAVYLQFLKQNHGTHKLQAFPASQKPFVGSIRLQFEVPAISLQSDSFLYRLQSQPRYIPPLVLTQDK